MGLFVREREGGGGGARKLLLLQQTLTESCVLVCCKDTLFVLFSCKSSVVQKVQGTVPFSCEVIHASDVGAAVEVCNRSRFDIDNPIVEI
jgi:hypothetical protein